MKRNELLRERAAPILAEFNEAVLALFEGEVDEIVTAARTAAVERVRAAFLGQSAPAVNDSPPRVAVRKKAKRSAAQQKQPRRPAVQRDEVIAQRDLKPDNVIRRRSSPTCRTCGTVGHNARGCRGGKGGGVELGEVARPTTDHDRRERIAAHQQRIAAERAAKEKQERDAWLEGATA